MSYVNRPADNFSSDPVVTNNVADYQDLVRWGPVFSGLVVALATQLVLSALGAALGTGFLSDSGAPRSNAGGVGTGIGIWSIISLLISLFVGGWITAHACGPMNGCVAKNGRGGKLRSLCPNFTCLHVQI